MSLTPGYGETPLDEEDLEALQPEVWRVFGRSLTKAEIYDLEQAFEDALREELTPRVAEGDLPVSDLLIDSFIRELHRRLYGDIWTWAGRYRLREINISFIPPEQVAVQLRQSLENLLYRWEYTNDWTPRELGIAAHAEVVRIHPFVDGNGRSTRLLADLVFLAAQDGPDLDRYDWDLDKPAYIRLLQAYDRHRDPRDLATFIRVEPITD
jgi:fido (protein-threonine AMPylation protein)